MKKILKYRILVSQKTIIAYFQGNIDAEDLINFKLSMSKDKNYNPTFSIISDLRMCHFNFKEEGVLKYISFVKENDKISIDRKIVFLTEKPNEVVIGTLFEILKGKLLLKSSIYTTVLSSVKWVFGSLDNLELIKDTLEQIKNNSDLIINNANLKENSLYN